MQNMKFGFGTQRKHRICFHANGRRKTERTTKNNWYVNHTTANIYINSHGKWKIVFTLESLFLVLSVAESLSALGVLSLFLSVYIYIYICVLYIYRYTCRSTVHTKRSVSWCGKCGALMNLISAYSPNKRHIFRSLCKICLYVIYM